jgi:ubiquitin C-terminal hydrolase
LFQVLQKFLPTQGYVGIKNFGNTGYMNSILQCLARIPQLQHYFSQSNWKDEINKTNPLGSDGEIVTEFAKIMDQIWNPTSSCITPTELKKSVGKYAPQFAGYNLGDCSEFLSFMIDMVHEDLNRILKKPYVHLEEMTGTDEEISKVYWDNFKLRNDSFIVDEFYGQTKTVVECPKCSKVKTVFDPLLMLSVNIPLVDRESMDLYDCISEFTKTEVMGDDDLIYCSNCKNHVNAKVSRTIWKLPNILLINLKRVVFKNGKMEKVGTFVNAPLQDFDLTKYVETKGDWNYDLLATSNNQEDGSCNSFCKMDDKWVKFADSIFKDINEKSVIYNGNYVLFYVKK